jgi:hypothetical protein
MKTEESMKKSLDFKIVIGAFLLVFAMGMASQASFANPASADPNCADTQAAMNEWAAQNPAATLADLRTLNSSEQRAAFRALASDVKASIWQERISEVLLLPLSNEQYEAVDQLRRLISATLYDAGAEGGLLRRTFADQLRPLADVFSGNEFRRFFSQLNLIDGSDPVNPDDPDYAAKTSCNCGTVWEDEWPGDDCWGSNNACATWPSLCNNESWGCGPFWMDICNGRCMPSHPSPQAHESEGGPTEEPIG